MSRRAAAAIMQRARQAMAAASARTPVGGSGAASVVAAGVRPLSSCRRWQGPPPFRNVGSAWWWGRAPVTAATQSMSTAAKRRDGSQQQQADAAADAAPTAAAPAPPPPPTKPPQTLLLDRVAALQARIRALDDAYHNTASPAASDDEYDALKALLRREEAALRASTASAGAGPGSQARRTSRASTSSSSPDAREHDTRRAQELLDSSPLKSVGAPVRAPALAAAAATAGGETAKRRSNSKRAAATPAQPAAKVRHPIRMLSLEAMQSVDAARRWGERAGRQLEAAATAAGAAELLPLPSSSSSSTGGAEERVAWVLEPKVDGLALRLTYRGGELVAAATRGDGDEGEDVTAAALAGALDGAPPRLSLLEEGEEEEEERGQQAKGAAAAAAAAAAAIPEVEVLGEAYLTADAFAALNARRLADELPAFSNARNAAAGSLRLADASAAAARGLSFVAYGLACPAAAVTQQQQQQQQAPAAPPLPPSLPQTHWGCLSWLGARGFGVSADNARLAGGFSEALSAAEAWMRGRGALPYEVDGAVLKLDDLRLRKLLGEGQADPRWAVAIKFPAREAVARLVRVDVAVGRSGAVTPVAVLEPVRVGGVTVARASLHNPSAAAALGLRPGDAVVVSRRGDVIPQVERVVEGARTGSEGAPWRPPQNCPHCGTALVQAASSSSAGRAAAVAAAAAAARDVEAAAIAAEAEAEAKASSAAPPPPPLLFCPNRSGCPAQAQRALEHYASVACGTGLGPATVRVLRDAGLARDPADLYALLAPSPPPPGALDMAGGAAAAAAAAAEGADLRKSGAELLAALPRFGPLKAAAALAAIEASRAAPARTVLAALGVPHVGQLTADRLAAACGDLRGVRDAALRAAEEAARRAEAAEAAAAEEERAWEAEVEAAALAAGSGDKEQQQQKPRQRRRKRTSTVAAAAAAAAAAPGPGETARLLQPGMAVGDALREWFADEDNARMLRRLAEGGVRAAASLLLPAGAEAADEAAAAASGPPAAASILAPVLDQPPQVLAGEQIVITGTLAGPDVFGGASDSDTDEEEEDTGGGEGNDGGGGGDKAPPSPGMPRRAVADLIEALGGRLRPSVTRSTSFVVVGAGAGRSKAREAARLGVPVVRERAFWQRLREGGWAPPSQ